MKTVVAAFALALAAAPAAQAYTVIGSFSGTVDDGTYANYPSNTTYAPGDTIAGMFVYDVSTSTFDSFEIGGYTASGATTILSPPLVATGFGFEGVEANDPTSGQPTAELVIDFYYENASALPSTLNIGSFVTNPGAYSMDLTGGSPSQFNVFLTNADGSVTTVGALLTNYTIPEPGAALLLVPAVAALARARRRA